MVRDGHLDGHLDGHRAVHQRLAGPTRCVAG
jgi:hypothetical protein